MGPKTSAYLVRTRGVRPVGGDHQVVLAGERVDVRGLGAEVDADAELRAAFLQDLQQVLAAHRGEPLAADRGHRAAEVHVDVVPAGEPLGHPGVDHRVGVLDAAQGLVAEHDAEAERVVGRVALPHADLGLGSQRLGRARRSTARRGRRR